MNSTARVHVGYVVSILIAINIVLLTVQWGGITDLADRLSFALTLASLVLSLLAIAYAVYSSGTLNQVLGRIGESTKSLDEVALTLGRTSEGLQARIDSIPGQLDAVTARVQATHDIVRDLAAAPVAQPGGTTVTPAATATVIDADRVLARASFLGMMGLLAAKRAHETRTGFSMPALSEKEPSLKGEYVYGYLVALSSLGILTVTVNKGVFGVPEMDGKLAEKVRARIEYRIDQMKTEEAKTRARSQIKNVEDFFPAAGV